jgi:hypothetical protein
MEDIVADRLVPNQSVLRPPETNKLISESFAEVARPPETPESSEENPVGCQNGCQFSLGSPSTCPGKISARDIWEAPQLTTGFSNEKDDA